MRTLTEHQARRIIRACEAVEAIRLHDQGYVWMRERLCSAAQHLEGIDEALTARGWVALAAVDELNGAYGVALRRLDAARARGCDDASARDLRLAIEEAAPRAQTWVTQVADALADFEPDLVLQMLAGRPGLEAALWRAAAHGAREDAAASLAEWTSAALLDGPVSLTPAHWYHLADDLFDAPAFWDALVRMSPRFSQCVGAVHASLYDHMCTRHPDLDAAFSATLAHMARFHQARCRGDVAALARMAAEVPEWSEIQP